MSLSCGGLFYYAIGKSIMLNRPFGGEAFKGCIESKSKVCLNPLQSYTKSNKQSEINFPLQSSRNNVNKIKNNSKKSGSINNLDLKKLNKSKRNKASSKKHSTESEQILKLNQRVVTVNDCQVQTEEDMSESEKEMLLEIRALQNRISFIEDIIAEKDYEIHQLRELNESYLKRTLSTEKADTAVQVQVQMETSIPESEFTREEIDDILHKLKKAHDNIASKDLQIGDLQRQIYIIQTKFDNQIKIYEDLRGKDEHILKDYEEQTKNIDKFKIQIRDSEEHNAQLTMEYDQLQNDFDCYKETKEIQIAELKIDNQNLIAEYEEFKANCTEYQQSVKSLKQCLDKVKSDYHLLSIENATLQRLLEKEKNMQSKYRHRSIENVNNSNCIFESLSQFSKSQINQFESLPAELPISIDKPKEQKYRSVRNTEERKRKESDHLLIQESRDPYQLNIRTSVKFPISKELSSPNEQSMILNQSEKSRGSKFSIHSKPK